MLERLGPDAHLVTIDTNADFTRYLREQIDDPRLITVTGSAADVEKILADRESRLGRLCALGPALLDASPGVGDAIAEATAKVIRPGGAFLVYQFSPKVLDFIKPHFAPIKRGFEWINVPPATLFWAYKGEEGLALRPEVQPPRDGIIHDVHQEVRHRPFEPPPRLERRLCSSGVIQRESRDLPLDIAAHRVGEAGVLDPQHDLHVDVEASVVEVR